MKKKVMAMLAVMMIMTVMFGSTAVLAASNIYDILDSNGTVVGQAEFDTDTTTKENIDVDGAGASTNADVYFVHGGWYYVVTGSTSVNGRPVVKSVDQSVLTGADKQKLKAAEKSAAVDKIDAISSTVGMEADLESGAELISPELRELIATVIGGLTIVILTAVGLFTAIDIFYLEVPPLHTQLEEGAEAKGHVDKNGQAKPRIVSKDACDAYREGSENGKNVIIVYLKKRIVAYIAIAVVVFLLLTGQLSAIIKLVLKLISGVLTSATNI